VIATSQAIIKSRLAGVIDYLPNKERLDKLTLGKLVNTYEIFGGNLELVRSLRELVKVRNNLAHEAFVLSPEEHENTEFLARRTSELNALHTQLGAAVRQLHVELKRLLEIGKKESKQLLVATTTALTPAADAPVAPATGAGEP